MKNLIFALSILAITISSCGGNDQKAEESSSGKNTAANATIKDDQLYPFMLGGVYFFHGYGGGKETLDKLIKGQMKNEPGDKGFSDELHTVYTTYFMYPFKPEEGGAKETLAEYWDVQDKTSFLETQEDLLANGHQAAYTSLLAADAKAITPEDQERVAFIQAHKDEFPKGGIKAWDIARYVNNTALGYAAGYLTKEEGNAALAKLTPIVKSQFANWAEYWKSYNLGRKFWAGDPEHDADFDKTTVEMQEGDYSLYKYMKL